MLLNSKGSRLGARIGTCQIRRKLQYVRRIITTSYKGIITLRLTMHDVCVQRAIRSDKRRFLLRFDELLAMRSSFLRRDCSCGLGLGSKSTDSENCLLRDLAKRKSLDLAPLIVCCMKFF